MFIILLIDSDYNVTIPGSADVLFYNIGGNTLKQCRDNKTYTQFFLQKPDKSCILLTSNIEQLNSWEEMKNNSTSLTNSTNGLKIKLNSGEPCAQGKFYQLNLEIECDLNSKTNEITFTNLDKFNKNNCDNTIQAKSKSACKRYNYYVLWTFFNKYYYAFGPLFIIAGLFSVFVAKRYWFITAFLLAYMLTVTIVLNITVLYYTFDDIVYLWIVVAGCLVPAVFIGLLFYKVQFTFSFTVGGYFGFALSFPLFYFIFYRLFYLYSVIILYLCIIIYNSYIILYLIHLNIFSISIG